MYLNKYHIHFVGIGGIGMSGIAELLLNLGYKVSGSDIKLSDITDRLETLGSTIFNGHDKKNISGSDVVVISSAVSKDNPEVIFAKETSIPVIPRAEMLAELMRLKYSIAVSGAHGKTSTTYLIASVLNKGGLDPTVVIGGKLKSIGSNAILGHGKFIVAEADESDGSFLKYSPTIAVVTNIDKEHLDFYKNIDAIKEVFVSFIDRIPFYGKAIICLDDEFIQDIIPKIKKRFTSYGLKSQADFQAREVVFEGQTTKFTLYYNNEKVDDFSLNMPGVHNVYNALASIAVGFELDIPVKTIKSALETLKGVQRRLEIKETVNNITFIDDYGHHPTEIKTTLNAISKCWPDRRKVVAFQPHRYTRTSLLFNEFSRSFYQSDILAVLPIYSAGEAEIKGVDSKHLCEAISSHGHKAAIYIKGFKEAVSYFKKKLKPDDIFLTLGAGDIWKLGESLIKALKE